METCYNKSSKYMKEVVQKYNLKYDENDNFIFLVGEEYYSTSDVNIANELDYASTIACSSTNIAKSGSELGYTPVLLPMAIFIALLWVFKFYREGFKGERKAESL